MAWLIAWAMLACRWICWQSLEYARVTSPSRHLSMAPGDQEMFEVPSRRARLDSPLILSTHGDAALDSSTTAEDTEDLVQMTGEPHKRLPHINDMMGTWQERNLWTFLYCSRRYLIGSRAMLKASGVFKCSVVTCVCDVMKGGTHLHFGWP